MARSVQTSTMIDRFRYSPGDGYVYRWPVKGPDEIHVYRIETGRGYREVATGDTLDAAGCPRTSTAMAMLVDQWRRSQPLGVDA
jgi:hypothetical protein